MTEEPLGLTPPPGVVVWRQVVSRVKPYNARVVLDSHGNILYNIRANFWSTRWDFVQAGMDQPTLRLQVTWNNRYRLRDLAVDQLLAEFRYRIQDKEFRYDVYDEFGMKTLIDSPGETLPDAPKPALMDKETKKRMAKALWRAMRDPSARKELQEIAAANSAPRTLAQPSGRVLLRMHRYIYPSGTILELVEPAGLREPIALAHGLLMSMRADASSD
jgi:hypothetical protein